MSKVSKTARASAVQTTTKASVIPDAELIRLLRIDRGAKLYPTVQGADALLRAFDEALLRIVELERQLATVINPKAIAEAPYADEVRSR